jgi:hypothetical protein
MNGTADRARLRARHPGIFYVLDHVVQYLQVAFLATLVIDQLLDIPSLATRVLLVIIVILGIITLVFARSDGREATVEPSQAEAFLGYGLLIAGVLLIAGSVGGLGALTLVLSLLGALILRWLLPYAGAADGENLQASDLLPSARTVASLLLLLLAVSVTLTLAAGVKPWRAIFSGAYLFFLGGSIWSYVLFDYQTIDGVERVALSFLLSMFFVPLLVFYLSRLGMEVTVRSAALTNLVFCTAGFVGFRYKHEIQRQWQRVRNRC